MPHPFHVCVPAATLLALLDTPPSARALTFSCNPDGRVWRHTTNAHTPLRDRVYIDDEPVLAIAARLLLARRPEGGRFELRPESLEVVAVTDEVPLLRISIGELAR